MQQQQRGFREGSGVWGTGRVGGAKGGGGVLTLTYLKGFSPVCVRMWLLSVVAPAKARPQ